MIKVTCAIIEDYDGRVLVAQRSSQMDLPFKWEFPGGKVELNESAEECLIREIKEELAIEITILKALYPVQFSYPDKEIHLLPFICTISKGTIRLKEHLAFKWLKTGELEDLDWAEADVQVVRDYLYGVNKS